MISTKTHFEHEINERKYELICDPNSPLGELHDVLCQWKGEIISRILEVQEAENKSSEQKEQVNDDQQAEG